MSIFKKFTESAGDSERARFRKELAGSLQSQDNLMMMDIAKILRKMPVGSSVVALRKYRGTILAGVVVLNGNTLLTTDLFSKGLLNPDGLPGLWRLIPESRLNLLKEFTNPPDAALAFFVLTPTGQYAFAFSHIVRSDGEVHWISDADWVCRVADVLVESGLFEAGAGPSAT
jgi:hypothetical protein